MSSSSDQECHEVHIDGPPDAGDRKSRLFDEVVVEYEWFASRLKAMKQSDKTTMTRSEMIGSSTSGYVEVRRDQREPAEVSTSGDQDENEGVVPGAKAMEDPSLAVPEKLEDLIDLTHTFHFSMGHRVLILRASDRPAYPPPSYVAISSHHLIVGLRFHLPTFLKRILNLLELALMQLSPNAYTRLLSFYLFFSRKGIGSLTDNIIRHCFLLKNCPLSKKPSGKAQHDRVYYLLMRASDYRELLQSDFKSNVGDYRMAYFYITGPRIESVKYKRFVLSP
ncbi:hypothetical protein ACOSQ3_022785 [Xanthoceras sorbifolium]